MRMIRTIEEAAAAHGSSCEEARCGCGSLLARVIEGAVELKCRRCKRVWRLALAAATPAEAGGRKTRSPAAARPRAGETG